MAHPEIFAADLARTKNIISPTPLATVLRIYTGARHECYIDYLHGAKALLSYFAPISVPFRGNLSRMERLLVSYEIERLAAYVVDNNLAAYDREPPDLLGKCRLVESAIVRTIQDLSYYR